MPVCPQCDNRPFANKEALLQHMKTSSAWHPVCLTCDRRFSSQDAYNAHMNDKHPPTFDCVLCNRQFAAPYALEDHYRGSQVHPNCVRCGRGFKDTTACDEHYRTAHPKVPCVPCGGMLLYADALQQHYRDSENHPSCENCHEGFHDSSAYNEHFKTSHDSMQASSPKQTEASKTSPYTTGFTPLSPKDRVQALIIGEKRMPSPDLRLDFSYSSPLTEVKPLFSPMAPSPLPRPGGTIEKLWTSRENITTSRLPLTPSPQPNSNSQASSAPHPHPYRHSDPGPSGTFIPSWYDTTQPVFQSQEVGRRISPPQVSPPLVGRHISPPQVSPPLMPTSQISPPIKPAGPSTAMPLTEFNSRLYPGSVRQAMRVASLNRHSPPFSNSQPMFQYNARIGPPLDDFAVGVGSRRSFDDKGFGSNLRSGSLASQSTSSLGRYRGASLDWPTGSSTSASLFSETPLTTPTATATTTTTTTPKLICTITPSSECPSPCSPEVSSPVGLGILPPISPLASTPVDPYDSDIPGARKPLPDSPVDVIADTPVIPLVSSNSVPTLIPPSATSPSLSTVSSSYVTSPQEPSDEMPKTNTDFATSSLSLSPQVGTSGVALSLIDSPTLLSQPEAIPISATRSSHSTTSTSIGLGLHPKPLHCRVCLADTCDDITASMCGHIFCNRCITDAVIKTNRCPVCMTPTLLYCLFRLDLAA